MADTDDVEHLVPDPTVAKEFGVTLMTLWRWDQSEKMRARGWAPKVQINGRNYRHRSKLEAFKRAMAKRDGEAA